MMPRPCVILLALCSLLTVEEALAQPAAPAVIVHNAIVFTAYPARPRAQALAVSGERIVAVGTDAEVLALAEGEAAEVGRAAPARGVP